MNLLAGARELAGEMAQLRHRLHQEPEIGLHLPRTQEKVLEALDGLPYEISLGTDCTSVTAVLRGTRGTEAGAGSRPVVLLRADMDALPVQEQSGEAYASTIDGVMHACGHDLHTAMLAGAARLLADQRDQLPGDVVLMFQPGEEGYNGAGLMIKEGVLEAAGRRADAAYGLHVMAAGEPHATFYAKPGPLMAAADGLIVTVHGAGGHGSAPHLAKDPVTAAAEMVTALQMMITRQFDMFDPVVLTVGLFQAGSIRNVIPAAAHFEATIRSFSPASQEKLMTAIPRLLEGIAGAHGVQVEVEYRTEFPLTVNNVEETENVLLAVSELFGAERFAPMANPMGASEDFSRVLSEVPGSFVFLSAAPPDTNASTLAFNHSPLAVFDDGVLADGAALYAQLALSRLTQTLRT